VKGLEWLILRYRWLPIKCGWAFRRLFVEDWVMCPMSKGKLHVKLLFKKKQVQNGVYFAFKHVLGDSKSLFSFRFYFQYVETAQELLRNHALVSTNSVRVKYALKCVCRLINPNSQDAYIFLSLIIRDFRLSEKIHFPSTRIIGSLQYSPSFCLYSLLPS
jgi:hypothetical protein